MSPKKSKSLQATWKTMKTILSAVISLLSLASVHAGPDLAKEEQAKLEKAMNSNDTIVLAKIESTTVDPFMASYSGKPSTHKGPNGASASGIMARCTATVIKVLKGEVTTAKIAFDLELALDGIDRKRDNPFHAGTNHVLMFRRKYQPITNETTSLGMDSWADRTWWPEDSPEGKFILSEMK